ncbi:hypothetical protein, partial [Streptomyces sp. NPDC057280]|uniref:hypothetical protein n=1 Tax=Streptomyces sp. NPDC057280 TaxID=3346081 RepID=UPI00362903B8
MPQEPSLGPHHPPPLPVVRMREQHPGSHGELTAHLVEAARITTTSGVMRSDPLILCEPLEVLTKALDVAVCDEAGGDAEEGFVDVVSSL